MGSRSAAATRSFGSDRPRGFDFKVHEIARFPKSIGSLVVEWDVEIANNLILKEVPVEVKEDATEIAEGVFVRVSSIVQHDPSTLLVGYEYRIEGDSGDVLPAIGKVEMVDASGARKRVNFGKNELATTEAKVGFDQVQFMGTLTDNEQSRLSFTLLTDIEQRTLRVEARDLVFAD